VDIRVKLPADVDVAKLRSLRDLIATEYPHEQERRVFGTQFEFKPAETEIKQTPLAGKIEGHLYTSVNKTRVVQFRLDGFSFSRLKPYESWARLREEAQRLWHLYAGATSPEMVTRVGLGYINRLEVPLPILELSEYLTAPPTVPLTLPQSMIAFLSRVAIEELSLEALAIITQAADSLRPGSTVAPIVLDINVTKDVQFSVDSAAVWETLDQLRGFKNQIFFDSVTEKTLELYQ